MLPGASDLAAGGTVPGGTLNNLDYTAPNVDFADDVPETLRVLLNDAQTSGGLLISLPADRADSLIGTLTERGASRAALIGAVRAAGAAGETSKILVSA